MALKVLVTSGGTTERIDSVRKITNMSTGRLGSLIADAFIRSGAEVSFVYGKGTLLPSATAAAYPVESVAELQATLETLFSQTSYDAVVHSMAVSDYAVSGVTTAEALAEAVGDALRRESCEPGSDRALQVIRDAIVAGAEARTDGKISSSLEHMLLMMEKTPKVIRRIRTLCPDTVLVGFKLLVGVTEEELLRVARELMEKSRCDYILANDLENIAGDRHEALLAGADGSLARMGTKEEIAREIVRAVYNKKGSVAV